MTKPRRLVYVSRQPIRWGDMDALGHVNNTVYFRYMEQTRIEWLYANSPMRHGATGPVIVNASCTFLVPLTYPGTVEVRMFLGELGRTSVESFYDLSMNSTRYAEGTARIVWIDRASGRPVPLPDAIAATVRAGADHEPPSPE